MAVIEVESNTRDVGACKCTLSEAQGGRRHCRTVGPCVIALLPGQVLPGDDGPVRFVARPLRPGEIGAEIEALFGQVPTGEIPHGRIRIVTLILCGLTIGRLHFVRVKLTQYGDDARRKHLTAIRIKGSAVGPGDRQFTEIEQILQLEFAAGPGVEGHALCPEIGMGRARAAPAGEPGIADEIVAEVWRSCLGDVHARLAVKPFAAEPLRYALPLLALQCGIDPGQNRCRITAFDAEQGDPADGLTPVAQGARPVVTNGPRNQRQLGQLVALIRGGTCHLRRSTRRRRG